MPQQSEEDIYKEPTKLEKVMQNIALLEQDLQDHPLVLEGELEGLTLQLGRDSETLGFVPATVRGSKGHVQRTVAADDRRRSWRTARQR